MGNTRNNDKPVIARKLEAVCSGFAGALQSLVNTFQQQWTRLSRMVVVVGIPATILYLCNGYSPPGSIWHNTAFVSAFQVRGVHRRTSLEGVAAACNVVASHSAAPDQLTCLRLSLEQQGDVYRLERSALSLRMGVLRFLGTCSGWCLHPLWAQFGTQCQGACEGIVHPAVSLSPFYSLAVVCHHMRGGGAANNWQEHPEG